MIFCNLIKKPDRLMLIGFLMLVLQINPVKAQLSFLDSGQRLGNGISNSVVLGDIDGDGDSDAVVANGSFDSNGDVEIWLNDGKGKFTSSSQTLNNGKNLGVSLADLNGDGSLDIFLCVGFGGPNKVFFNDGHGHFTDSGQELGNANSSMVGLADLDGDGDTDAFVYVHPIWNGSESVHFGNEVWLNDGKGYFTNTNQQLGNGYNSGGAIEDIDGDGDVDAATASNFKNIGIKRFINNGKGNFSENDHAISTLNSFHLSFGDLDGDGDKDVFVIYSDTSHKYFNGVWFNDGKGNFTESSQKFGVTPAIKVCLGDVDNDSDLDAFVTGGKWNTKEVSKIWLNNGKGFFTDSLEIGFDESNDAQLADLDGDGDLDVFIANNGPNKVYLNFTNENTNLYGDYLGQTPPGDTAVIFAPGISSRTNRAELKIAFSPDGNECYFYSDGPNGVGIYYTKRENNKWTEQVIAPFSLNHITTDPFFSADGKKLYFTYNTSDWSGGDIWFVERTKDGWSEPQMLPSPINSNAKDWGYTETADGTAYIQSNRTNGDWDIWRIQQLPDQSFKAENLGPVVNSAQMDLSPCIAPDGSFLIFSSARPGGISIQDLYISFNKGNNEWTEPVNMEITGAKINIAGYNQSCPSLSPDGRFLFFCNHSHSRDKIDIYWVSTKVIEDIKREVFNSKGTK